MGVPLLVCASHTAAIVRIGVTNVRIGMGLNYSGGFAETVEEVGDLEKAGLDIAFVPEAYSFDDRQPARLPGGQDVDHRTRFGNLSDLHPYPFVDRHDGGWPGLRLQRSLRDGTGALSGPQVIEGFHGVKYDAPLGRTREVVEICRQVWAPREGRVPGQVLPGSPPRREGHRTRKAAQADQSSCA